MANLYYQLISLNNRLNKLRDDCNKNINSEEARKSIADLIGDAILFYEAEIINKVGLYGSN